MRKTLLYVFLFFTAIHLNAQQSTLRIEVLGIKDVKGIIQVGIYNDRDAFPKIGKEFKIVYALVSSEELEIAIDNLDQGEYSIALYQDLNKDGKCNTNFISIPQEPYGFSNNYRPIFKSPNFAQTKFSLDSDLSIQIELIH